MRQARQSQLIQVALLAATAIILGIVSSLNASMALAAILFVFIAALFVLVMIYRPFYLLLFMVIYLPFETLGLKFLIPEQFDWVGQIAIELVTYLAFGFLVIRKILNGETFRKTPLDLPILVFLFVAVLSIVLNGSPILGSLLNLRSLLRFVVLYYLVVNINLSRDQAKLLFLIIIIVGLTEVAIGLAQVVTKGQIDSFFLPRATDIEFAGQIRRFRLLTTGREIGSAFGTLGDTVYFGLFMIIFGAVYFGKIKRFKLLDALIIILMTASVAYSFARAALFGFFLLILVIFLIRIGSRRLTLIAIATTPFITAAIIFIVVIPSSSTSYINPVFEKQSIVQNVTGIFSDRYIEIAKNQRLGFLISVAPTVITNKPFLGYGPDKTNTISQLNNARSSFLVGPVREAGFDDVYWVSLLSYYGIIGISLLFLIFIRIFRSARFIYRNSADQISRKLALTVMGLAIVTPFLLFFYQALEFRVYGFFFWLLIGMLFGLKPDNKQISTHNHHLEKSI